jgi:hypothetical protein
MGCCESEEIYNEVFELKDDMIYVNIPKQSIHNQNQELKNLLQCPILDQKSIAPAFPDDTQTSCRLSRPLHPHSKLGMPRQLPARSRLSSTRIE